MKALQVDSLKRELEHYKTNGNGNPVSPTVSPTADEIIKRLTAQISSLRGEFIYFHNCTLFMFTSLLDELNMQYQIMKAKDQLIKQIETRDSPVSKMSAPTSTDQSPNTPKLHTKYSPPKASPTRRTTSSQLISYDDSYPMNNSNRTSLIQQPNMHGSLTLPRPIKHRPKLQVTEKSDEL